MTRVLIVDDDPVGCESLSVVLDLEGFEVKATTDGPEAIEIAKEFLPDVLVVDLMLCGELDGIQVAEAHKQCDPTIQTIVISGHVAPEVGERLGDDASMRWLTKPADPQELVRILREAAQRKIR